MLQSFRESRKEQNKEQLCTGLTCWVMVEALFLLHRQSLAEHYKVAKNWLLLLRNLTEVLLPSLLMFNHHKYVLRQPCVALFSIPYQQGDDGNL